MSDAAAAPRGPWPAVSVIMTTYNGAAFVADAVGSILGQDHRALEVVAVDDGSTDATVTVLERIAAVDGRLRVFARPHRGIARSRNDGLEQSRAPLVAFLDQDDLWPPGRMSRQVARLASEPTLAALFAETVMFGNGMDPDAALNRGPRDVTMLISSALFRREIFTGIGAFDAAYEMADDFDFVLRVQESTFRFDVEPEVGVLHRRHAGQRSADLDTARREAALALARSLRRRRAAGMAGPLPRAFVRGSAGD